MSEARNMSVKAFLTHPDGNEEVRRFGIPEGASTNYSYLQERIRTVFNIGSEIFNLHWQDSDGDYISISSDEELFEALTESVARQDQQILRVYVTFGSGNKQAKGDKFDRDYVHFGVSCDGCNGKVIGVRFKCSTCSDFDLCSTCESKGVHKHHQFQKITNIFQYEKDFPTFGININAHTEGFPEEFPGFPGWRRCGRGRGGGRGGWRRWAQQQQQQQNRHHQQHQHQHQQQQQQQQQQQFSDGNFSRQFGNMDERNPFQFSFSNSTAGGCPVMGFGAGFVPPFPDMGFPDSQKIAEEAGKFASQMASKQVADIMKGMWTAWSGNQEATNKDQTSSTSEGAPGPGTSKDADKEKTDNDLGIINIDISLDDDNSAKQKESEENSVPVSARLSRESVSPDIVLMDTDEPSRPPSGQNSPSNGEAWTLLHKDSTPEASQAPRAPQPATETITFPSEPKEMPPKSLYPNLPSAPPSQPHPNERVRHALEQMRGMGYSDEGGWLTRLLEMKDGDINKVLDILLVQRK